MWFPLVPFLDQKTLKIAIKKKKKEPEVNQSAVNRQADELEILFFCSSIHL